MMERLSLSVLVFAAMVVGSTAFAPLSANLVQRNSHHKLARFASPSATLRSLPVMKPRTAVPPLRMSRMQDEEEIIDVGDVDPNSKTLDEWFEQLGDDENSVRTAAGYAIKELHDKDGKGQEVIDRLIAMLTLEEVLTRRAAVQCLGMIGNKILDQICELLLTTDNMTIRASCSKVLGAVALRNPNLIVDYPQKGLDGMRKAILEIPDPVTKVASMSALAQIAGGDRANGHVGCMRALDLILELTVISEDVALLLSCVNALASVGKSNPEWKDKIVDGLKTLRDSAQKQEGMDIVLGNVKTQLAILTGESQGNEGSMGFSTSFLNDDDDDDDDEDWDDFKF